MQKKLNFREGAAGFAALGGALVWGLLLPMIQNVHPEWMNKPWQLQLTALIIVVCFLPAFWLIGNRAKGYLRGVLLNHPRISRVLLFIIKPVIIGVPLVLFYVLFMYSKKPTEKSDATPSPPPPQKTAILDHNFTINMRGLPIGINPYQDLWYVGINDDRTAELRHFGNNGPSQYAWPSSKNIRPPETYGVLTITNRGDVGVFDVDYSMIIAIGEQADKAGVKFVTLSLPKFNLFIGQTQTMYFVNKSDWGVGITLPTKVTGALQGEIERTAINMKERTGFLFTSYHVWNGDFLVHEDAWKYPRPKRHS